MNSRCSSTRSIATQQERLVTSRTKVLVDHAPINAYVLNISALHNYQHIEAAIPSFICDQIHIPFIRDHPAVRLHAASLLRSRKGKDLTADTISAGSEQPAFDHIKKTHAKGKGKGKASPIQSATGSAGPSNLSNPQSQTLVPHSSQSISQAGPSTTPVISTFASGFQVSSMPYLPPPTAPFVQYGAIPQMTIHGTTHQGTLPTYTYSNCPPPGEPQAHYSFGS